MVQHERDLL
jgi:hypothetical protein